MKPNGINVADRFVVAHVDHNGVGAYQVKDTVTDCIRSVYTFERFAIDKAFQLNRDEAA